MFFELIILGLEFILEFEPENLLLVNELVEFDVAGGQVLVFNLKMLDCVSHVVDVESHLGHLLFVLRNDPQCSTVVFTLGFQSLLQLFYFLLVRNTVSFAKQLLDFLELILYLVFVLQIND